MTFATPDTLLRWYRWLIAQKFDGTRHHGPHGRPHVLEEIEQLTIRMAEEDLSWSTALMRAPFGEGSLLYVVRQYLAHYHHERNHQGLDNQLIAAERGLRRHWSSSVHRGRLGGLLSYYYREAA